MPQQSYPSAFEAQFARVFEAALCQTQNELARFLGVTQSGISDAKRRKRIPAEWRIKLFEKKRINPDWVLCGSGGKYLTATDAAEKPSVVRITEIRPPRECTTQELFDEMVRRSIRSLDTTVL